MAHGGAGWNLIGNPNTFKTYANRPYYRINETGTAFEYVTNYWEEPIPVCGGILIISNVDDDYCTFTRTAPETPTVTPAPMADIPLTILSHGSDADLDAATILASNADNSGVISTNTGSGKTVVLQDRTLFKDGYWNTLCLPFNLTISGSVLDGDNVDVRTLSSGSLEDGTLTLNFTEKDAVTAIEAGKPYIVKWSKTNENDPNLNNLVNPVFTSVTIDKTMNDVNTSDGKVTFKGNYDAQSFDAENKSILLVGGNNLYWPLAGASIKACRSYFQIGASPDPSQGRENVREFVLNFGEKDTTGIIDAVANSSLFTLHSSLSEWYSLDGRKLDKQPTKAGLYIHEGKKLYVK